MCLICHNDNIPTLRQCFSAFLKLLHCCKDNAVCLTICQKFLEMLSALSVLRSLSQKILASCKLTVELIIQVVSVCDHDDCRAFQSLLQIVGIKHHRQWFSTALSVPENTAFAICYGCVLCRGYGLLDRKILMITGKDFECILAVNIKANKVL